MHAAEAISAQVIHARVALPRIFSFYNTEPCKGEAKRENWYTTAEKVPNGRGHNGDRSAQAEQRETYVIARTVSAAFMDDQPAGLRVCVSSR